MEEKYRIGDKVYFIKSFDEVYWRSGKFRPVITKHPLEKKITQIVHNKNEILYQVKGGHFPISWVGNIVFNTKEEAEQAIINQ